ncbi:MAG: 2'-deoxycytidine 5'-triphosphate deaminase, partial [Hyphomicrobiaceae bacterium]
MRDQRLAWAEKMLVDGNYNRIEDIAMTDMQTALPQASDQGILPAQTLRGMIAADQIKLAAPLAEKQLQPASLDLRLGTVAYRIRASFLPARHSAVQERIESLSLHKIELTHGAVLETGCVYIVPLMETLALPEHVSAATNPKSSTGRLDVFTRVIADGVNAFDFVPNGYRGPLFAEICPQTFPIIVRSGSTLSQIRFRIGQPAESDESLRELHRNHTLIAGGSAADIQNGIALSVDLSGDQMGGSDGLVG